MNIKTFCCCSLFPSWLGLGLISTPVLVSSIFFSFPENSKEESIILAFKFPSRLWHWCKLGPCLVAVLIASFQIYFHPSALKFAINICPVFRHSNKGNWNSSLNNPMSRALWRTAPRLTVEYCSNFSPDAIFQRHFAAKLRLGSFTPSMCWRKRWCIAVINPCFPYRVISGSINSFFVTGESEWHV